MAFANFQRKVLSPGFGLFLLMKLPSAFFCGVRVRKLEPDFAEVSIPYKWLSQNPFNSIYFACQAMAAEMSTGVLAMAHLHGLAKPVSMLVQSVESVFTKKATERIYFLCNDGLKIQEAIEKALQTGEGVEVIAESVGKTVSGIEVSRFRVVWSFKVKR